MGLGADHPGGRKRCPRCRKVKARSEFVRNRSSRDGLGSYCKPCHRVIIKSHQDRLYGGHRNFLLQLRYGLSEAEFEKIVRKQGGRCAICRRRPAKHVDHNRRTGEVRAILCFYCNRGLGKFRDDPRKVRKALKYLAKAKGTKRP